MTEPMQIQFERIERPVWVDDGPALLPALESTFRYWPFREVAEVRDDEPVVTVRRDGNGYRVHADWLIDPPRYSNPVNLACGLAVNVNRAMLQGSDSYLCLHGAGVEIGGRLVVLPNYYRAGKSALTVSLAAAGARVFTDDILPVLPDGSGMALGVSPRLRLPLPEAMGTRSLRYTERRRGAANSQYLYLALEPHEQARFGDSSRIGGFVLLDRRESGGASLTPASNGEVLKQLVLRNFARQVPVAASLDRLHGLVRSAACYRLAYANGDEAVDLLMERFAGEALAAAGPTAAPEPAAGRASTPSQPAIGGTHPRRRDGVAERLVEGDLFIVDGTGESIYHLNPIGAGLWRLMDGSCGVQEAAELLHQAFPDVERKKIERDVAALTYDLLRRGLLVHGRCSSGNRRS